MKYNYFGNTGLAVSELCFGTMTFGGEGYWKPIGTLQQDDATALVKAATDAGINFIDTANVYSFGESERLLGKALKDLNIKRPGNGLAPKLMPALVGRTLRVAVERDALIRWDDLA